jgi:hypothetical protein
MTDLCDAEILLWSEHHADLLRRGRLAGGPTRARLFHCE